VPEELAGLVEGYLMSELNIPRRGYTRRGLAEPKGRMLANCHSGIDVYVE
ncbi:3234_t:CDS:2, partial [Cetraspora pellucida]